MADWWLTALPLVVSAIALGVSITNVRLSHTAPFRLKVASSAPEICFHKIGPEISGNKEGETWWIPSAYVCLTLLNEGKRPGDLIDLRIRAVGKDENGPFTIMFRVRDEVDFAQYVQHRHDRMQLLNNALERPWYPFIVPGNGSRVLHAFLDADRMEAPIVGEENTLVLFVEYFSSEGKDWKMAQAFEMPALGSMFKGNVIYSPPDPRIQAARSEDGETEILHMSFPRRRGIGGSIIRRK